MKLYQNLWAGHPTYFLETARSNSSHRKIRKGIGFWFNGDGKVYIDFRDEYYDSSFKENPERFPMLGEMSDEEFAQLVLGKFGVKKENK